MLSSCISLGMAVSACTQNQLVALTLSFILIIGLWFLMGLAPLLPSPFSETISYISLLTHVDAMSKGLLQTRDLLYFFSMTAFFLLCCERRVEAYRWQ